MIVGSQRHLFDLLEQLPHPQIAPHFDTQDQCVHKEPDQCF